MVFNRESLKQNISKYLESRKINIDNNKIEENLDKFEEDMKKFNINYKNIYNMFTYNRDTEIKFSFLTTPMYNIYIILQK